MRAARRPPAKTQPAPAPAGATAEEGPAPAGAAVRGSRRGRHGRRPSVLWPSPSWPPRVAMSAQVGASLKASTEAWSLPAPGRPRPDGPKCALGRRRRRLRRRRKWQRSRLQKPREGLLPPQSRPFAQSHCGGSSRRWTAPKARITATAAASDGNDASPRLNVQLPVPMKAHTSAVTRVARKYSSRQPW